MPQGSRWFVMTHNGVEVADKEVGYATELAVLLRADGERDTFATTQQEKEPFLFALHQSGAMAVTSKDGRDSVVVYAPTSWVECRQSLWTFGQFD